VTRSEAKRGPKQDAATWTPPSRRRVRAIRDRLRDIYGIPLAKPHGHPIAELILTVLSQVDQRPQPRRRVPGAPRAIPHVGGGSRCAGGRDRVRDPARRDLEGQVGADQVDPPVDRGAAAAAARTGPGTGRRPDHLSLDWLPRLSVPEAQRYLTALPGVGRKTAACVLLFALGMRDVPVDTHVSRVGTRLGLFRPEGAVRGAPRHDARDHAAREELELHLNMLRHGRRTCHARGPDCAGCSLNRICPSAFKV